MALKMDHTGAGDITLDSTAAGELRVDGNPVLIPDLAGLATGNFLYYDGADWVPNDPLTYGVVSLQPQYIWDSTGFTNGLNIKYLKGDSQTVNIDFCNTTSGNVTNRFQYTSGEILDIQGTTQMSGTTTFTVKPIFPQGGTGTASINFPGGTANPSASVNGDMWGRIGTAKGLWYNIQNTPYEIPLLGNTEGKTWSAKQTWVTPTTSTASINLPHGTAPTTPVDGDLWTTTTGVFARVNGVTEDLTAGAATLGDLSDVDLTGAADGDLFYRAAGTWQDTAGNLTWSGSLLEVAGEIRNTTNAPAFTGRADATAGARRLLEFENWDGVSAYEDNWRMIFTSGAGNAAVTSMEVWTGAAFQPLIRFDPDGTETNRLIFRDGATSDQNFNIVKPGADGDAILTIEADSDNLTEASNPYVRLWQDGQAIGGLIGLTGAANEDSAGGTFTGAQNNSLAIHMDTVTSATDGIALGVNGTAKLVIQRDNPTQIRDNLDITGNAVDIQGVLPLITFGSGASGFTGTLGTTQHTDSAALQYRTYLAHDCYWDETNDQWVAHRTTLDRKFAVTMGYHQHDMQFRYYGGSAATPWADSAWTSMLTLDPGNSLTSTPYPLRTGGNIGRSIDTSSLTVFGGNATGANVELYGGSHATLANHAYFDADDHYFRTQNAGTTMATLTTGGLVSNVTIFAGSGNLNDGDIMLRLNSDRAWDFKQHSADASAALKLMPTSDSKAFRIHNQADAMNFYFLPYNTGTGDPQFRCYDATGTDYVEFSHDGTDFNITASGTTDINFSGAALVATAIELTTGGPIYCSNGSASGGISMDTAASDGNGIKRITWNDGGGNFQIRAGNYYSAGDKFAGAGAAGQLRMDTDSAPAVMYFRASTNTSNATADTAVTWGPGITITGGATGQIDFDGTAYFTNTIYPQGQTIGQITAVTGSFGSIEVTGADGSSGTWSGYSIGGEAVFMSNLTGSGTTNRFGLYDDINNAWAVEFNSSASGREVSLYHAGVEVFYTANEDGNNIGTGAEIRHADQSFYPVGMNVSAAKSNPGSFSAAATWLDYMGHTVIKTNTTAFTATTPASTDTTIPNGGVWNFLNFGGTGNITIAAGSGVTLTWMDGAGGATGSRTIADGGVATLWKRNVTNWYIWGNGIA